MTRRWPRRGLYLVTPEPLPELACIARLLPHAACLQYRSKQARPDTRRRQALALRALCAEAGVMFLVNDDVVLAETVSADGVHVGEHDVGVAEARARLGEAAIVGSSCYDDLARAEDAVRAGASYVAFGAFFPSSTKPHARHATPQLLRDAARFGLPRVAIGGITPDNAAPLVAAGADLIAVISGVFDAKDPVAAARGCAALFD
jgi:thiamine-phosphate pyrophosphorylase